MTGEVVVAEVPIEDQRGEPAGIVSRAIAYVIDAVIISVTTSISLFAVQAALNVLFVREPSGVSGVDDLAGAVAFGAALASVAFVYFTAGFWLFGRTVGKLALGLRVVRADGGRPRLVQSAVRTLGYLLSSILLLGFLAIAVSRQHRAWHDHLARTWVVYDWAAAPRLAAADQKAPLPPRRRP